MRCDQCNKFVSFEENEPEVNDIAISDDGTITAEVRIVNSCVECGQELKEGTLNLEEQVDVSEHSGEGHELEIEEDGADRTGRSGYFKKGQFVPAFGRYAKNFYGAAVGYKVTCSCNENFELTGTIEDDMQASEMDELV